MGKRLCRSSTTSTGGDGVLTPVLRKVASRQRDVRAPIPASAVVRHDSERWRSGSGGRNCSLVSPASATAPCQQSRAADGGAPRRGGAPRSAGRVYTDAPDGRTV